MAVAPEITAAEVGPATPRKAAHPAAAAGSAEVTVAEAALESLAPGLHAHPAAKFTEAEASTLGPDTPEKCPSKPAAVVPAAAAVGIAAAAPPPAAAAPASLPTAAALGIAAAGAGYGLDSSGGSGGWGPRGAPADVVADTAVAAVTAEDVGSDADAVAAADAAVASTDAFLGSSAAATAAGSSAAATGGMAAAEEVVVAATPTEAPAGAVLWQQKQNHEPHAVTSASMNN